MIFETFIYNLALGIGGILETIFGALEPLPSMDFSQIVGLAKAFDSALPVSEALGFTGVLLLVSSVFAVYGTVREIRSWFPFWF